MSAPRNDLPTEIDTPPAPDMLAELGPLAYGLFVLTEKGPLGDLRSLSESERAQLPTQTTRSPERGDGRSEALLNELGALDL